MLLCPQLDEKFTVTWPFTVAHLRWEVLPMSHPPRHHYFNLHPICRTQLLHILISASIRLAITPCPPCPTLSEVALRLLRVKNPFPKSTSFGSSKGREILRKKVKRKGETGTGVIRSRGFVWRAITRSSVAIRSSVRSRGLRLAFWAPSCNDCDFLIIDHDAIDLFNHCIPNVYVHYFYKSTPRNQLCLIRLSISRSLDILHRLKWSSIVVYRKGASTVLTVEHLVNITNEPPEGWYTGESVRGGWAKCGCGRNARGRKLEPGRRMKHPTWRGLVPTTQTQFCPEIGLSTDG